MKANRGVISKYVFRVPYDDGSTILYNSLNSAVVLAEDTDLNECCVQQGSADWADLCELGFFEDENSCYEAIERRYDAFHSNTLELIIELTKNCNLACVYCYQLPWGKEGSINLSTIENITTYIQNCLATYPYQRIRLNYFGGEPLLAWQKLVTMHQKIESVCANADVELWAHLDTNGVLLSRDLLCKLSNIRLGITLSPPIDHEKKRLPLNNRPTYQKILNNIVSCRDLFNDGARELHIRYNIDQDNREYLSDFLDTLIALNVRFTPRVEYTYVHGCTPYQNHWSYNDFRVWNSSDLIDLLIAKKLNVVQKPHVLTIPCRGYYGHNIKVFCDGSIGMCNGSMPGSTQVTIDSVIHDPDKVIAIFPQKKARPFDNLECRACQRLALCGGRYFCKKTPCDPGTIDLPTYLRTYVRHAQQGNAEYFVNFA
jgi:sulfatase maturation enzyme AslB (radical SAM superfamily)